MLPCDQSLKLGSSLQELPLEDAHLDVSCLGKQLLEYFDRSPAPSGVIVTEKSQFIGLISRRRFLEKMNLPYAKDLFMRRSIGVLLDEPIEPFSMFPGITAIVNAARDALKRSPKNLYEPIIVVTENRDYRLLAFHDLMMYSAKIHELARCELALREQELARCNQELEDANRELKRLVNLDGLTQVESRRRFDERLTEEWHRLAREHHSLALIMCDVDYFKLYNDTFGHQAGDECLRHVGAALQRVARRPADVVARYGGEEFAILLPYTDLRGATHLATEAQNYISALAIAHPNSPISSKRVTLSYGVAVLIPSAEETPATLIKSADEMLYLAKREGRDRIMSSLSVVYPPSC